MKFRVGDKVKFLNDVGGGVVTKIISPSMVNVQTDDGFEYPVITSELILAVQDDKVGAMFNQDFVKEEISSEPVESFTEDVDDENDFERESKLGRFTSLKQHADGIYLAFVPHDQVWLTKDDIDVYLINKTSNYILYNLFLENDEEYDGEDYGSVSPFSKYLITTISREEISFWAEGVLQILYHKDKVKSPLAPTNSVFTIKGTRFFSKENYELSSFLEEKSVLYFVEASFDEPEAKKEISTKEKNSDAETETITKFVAVEKDSVLANYRAKNGVYEIDLHIETLIEKLDISHDISNELDKIQILQIQLSHFEKCLNEAIRLKLPSIAFIHGVGIGRLKTEMEGILDRYSDVHYSAASRLTYGAGAMEVWIKE